MKKICCFFQDQFVSHHIYISLLIQRKSRELDFLSFRLVHSQDHRVGYCDSKTKIGRTVVKLPPPQTEFYLRARELCEITQASTTWKIQECGRSCGGFWVHDVSIPTPVKPNLLCRVFFLGRACRQHGEFPHPMKWKIWPWIASVAKADPVSGQRLEHFGEQLQKSWDEGRQAAMQTVCRSTDKRQCKQESQGLINNPWAPGFLRIRQ